VRYRWMKDRCMLVAGLAFCGTLAAISPRDLASQSVGIGADFVSRYVWRGLDFGESFSVQPSFSITTGRLELGAWGSYSISADGAGANENDLYLSYSIQSESGAGISFGVTDYYFPTPPVEEDHDGHEHGHEEEPPGFFHSESHYLEPFVQLSGPTSFPASLFVGVITATTTTPTTTCTLRSACRGALAARTWL